MSADDPTRCPYVNTHFRNALGRMREDGWRCAKEPGHVNGHVLMDAEGERVLDQMGPWEPVFEVEEVLPTDEVAHIYLTDGNPERLGAAMCGQPSSRDGMALCPQCRERSYAEHRADDGRILAELHALAKFLLPHVPDTPEGLHKVLDAYIEQSPAWRSLTDAERAAEDAAKTEEG